MLVSVEKGDAGPLVAKSPPPHVMAQQAFLVTKLSVDAIIAKKGSAAAAGYDLSSAVDEVVSAQEKAIVPTDLVVAVSSATYDSIAPMSGLAAKHLLAVGARVIDSDF